MPPKPTKGNAPVVVATEALNVQSQSTNERSEPMNSNSHSHTVPALSYSLEGFQLRIIMIDFEPWFVAIDVCEMLGLKNSRMALQALDKDEVRVSSTYTLKGFRDVQVISESGFYTLILRCRDAVKAGSMPHRVRRWVTSEVLPSIRKTGSYSVTKQVPRDRQLRVCSFLMSQVERSTDAFVRAGQMALVAAAYADADLQMPDLGLLRPLQMPIDWEGGAA